MIHETNLIKKFIAWVFVDIKWIEKLKKRDFLLIRSVIIQDFNLVMFIRFCKLNAMLHTECKKKVILTLWMFFLPNI